MKSILIVALISICCISCIKEKKTKEKKLSKVDSLFQKYQKGNSPGYALGIVQNGELTYSKGYGYSNLEYNIAISDSSSFYIGSMAKQFTAAALLILEAEEKLDFNQDVSYYLPDFPKYHEEITVAHLVHHTSGIRETNSLQLFQGIDPKFEEHFNTEDLLQLVKAQEELNFKPGEKYRYSSGGYAVLAKIVENVSGIPFREFLQKRIFEPLRMENTFVCDNRNEVIKNRAISYWPVSDNKFERRLQVFDAYGDGGIITNIKDLAKWDNAFYSDILGVKNFAEKMYQTTKLNDGNSIKYARALNVTAYKGQKVVQHNGGMLGFRVDMVRFPEQRTSIILLGNSAYLDPTGDALKIAEILLGDKFSNSKSKEEKLESDFSATNLKEKGGYYWTDEFNYFRRITYQNDSLFFDSGNEHNKQYLLPISNGKFYLNNLREKEIAFISESEFTLGKQRQLFRKFDPKPPSHIGQLKKYSGIYESRELETIYKIYEEKNILFLKINRKEPVQIFPVPENSRVVWNGSKMIWIGFGEIKFDIDKNNTVNGLTIGDQRVSGVYFKKTN